MSPQRQTPETSRSIFLAAAMVGATVLIAGFVLARGLDRATAQLAATTAKLESVQLAAPDAMDALANLRAPAAAAPRGPDPNRRYTLNLAGSPGLGPAQAPVTIVA